MVSRSSLFALVIACLACLACSGCLGWDRFEGDADGGTSIDGGAPADGAIDAPADAIAGDAGCVGCMLGSVCMPGTSGRACGTGGAACIDCGCDSDTCETGACVPARPTVDIAMGHHYACFVVEGGSVHCMGDNELGQLGNGAQNDGSPTPVTSAADDALFDLAAGGDVFVVARASTTHDAQYWGIQPGASLTTAPMTRAVTLGRVLDEITGGGEHACGIAPDDALYCTGGNDVGQLGIGDTMNRLAFVEVGGAWNEVSAGLSHTCGIQRIGTRAELYCWGENGVGQLGVGDQVDRSTPTRVGMASDWQDVSAGKDFTCGIRSSRVYCWGNNDVEQLGVAAVGSSMVFTVPQGPLDVFGGVVIDDPVDVDSGRFHSCVLRANGSIWCWGNGECGALGHDMTPASTDLAVEAIFGAPGHGDRWDVLEVGHHITCATRANGSLWCWGRRGPMLVAEDTLCSPSGIDAAPTRICL